MRDQLALLRDTDWQALIVLDACRADEFRRLVPAAETVRSPARRTPQWLRACGPMLAERGAMVVTGNPIVTRDLHGVPTLDVWKVWGEFTPLRIPCVSPWAVSGAAFAYAVAGGTGRPIVAWYLQPHSPYIGQVPCLLTWLRQGHPDATFVKRLNRVSQWPGQQMRQGRIDWPELRAAYRANLALAWDAARALADSLARDGRRVVVTSDHGELLGEGGLFGHQAEYHHSKLRDVPWLEYVPEDDGLTERQRTAAKLEALGYLA